MAGMARAMGATLIVVQKLLGKNQNLLLAVSSIQRQKVFTRGALRLCLGFDILKFDKLHWFILLHISSWSGLEVVLRRLSPPKPPWWGDCTAPLSNTIIMGYCTNTKHCDKTVVCNRPRTVTCNNYKISFFSRYKKGSVSPCSCVSGKRMLVRT